MHGPCQERKGKEKTVSQSQAPRKDIKSFSRLKEEEEEEGSLAYTMLHQHMATSPEILEV